VAGHSQGTGLCHTYATSLRRLAMSAGLCEFLPRVEVAGDFPCGRPASSNWRAHPRCLSKVKENPSTRGLHLAYAMLQQRPVPGVPERLYRRERRTTPNRLHAGGSAMISEDALRRVSREERAALSRSLAAINDELPPLSAGDERRRRFVVLLTGASVGLIPRIVLLAITLPHRYVADPDHHLQSRP
jgi:hypothetical protein